jgi:hypothetical protein
MAKKDSCNSDNKNKSPPSPLWLSLFVYTIVSLDRLDPVVCVFAAG